MPPATDTLALQHQKELVTRRGLSAEWTNVNCRSVTAAQASELLGYTAQSDGIWLEGSNMYGQFKPDKAWKADNEKGKAPKYRSGLGEYDAILPKHPTHPRFWDDLEALKKECYTIDGIPCIVVTEGVFKAIAGCSIGIPTLSLSGVEMGLTPATADPQGKRYLVPALERLAKAGFGFIIAFDADCAENPAVRAAQDKLAHQLVKFNVPVYCVTGLWKVDDSFDNRNKGMDDYILNHGEDNFRREVLAKAVSLESWEAQFRKEGHNGQAPKVKDLTPRLAAKQILERYRNQWKYDLGRQTWRHWDKVWAAVQDEVFQQIVYRELESMKNVNYSTFSYVENVVKFLKVELLEPQWITFNRMEWIAFNDCVLEVSTGKMHEHAPGFGFTSCLEHHYPKLVAVDPASSLLDQLRVHAPGFYAWAMYAQKGDPMKVLKLLAICNGVIKYRFFDLQLFVLLLGVPGAGKGTFARLLESMVGKPNYTSAKLHKLGEDNILAAIIDKQLVVCPDEKKAGSDYSGLLSLTGGDSIPYRPIYRPQASGRFYGAVVLIANQYPFYGDTSGIARRECLVNFDTPIPQRDSSVEKKIQEEVGAIMALALFLPDSQVTELLTGTGAAFIPDLKRQAWLNKVENDSVALFLEECLVQGGQDSYLPLGGKGDDIYTLYGAYLAFCEQNNSKSPFSRQNFRAHFIELCSEIGWNGVEAKRKENGWRVYGVRLRSNGEDSAHVSDLLMACKPCTPPVGPPVEVERLSGGEPAGAADVTPPLSPGKADISPYPSAPEAIAQENRTPVNPATAIPEAGALPESLQTAASQEDHTPLSPDQATQDDGTPAQAAHKADSSKADSSAAGAATDTVQGLQEATRPLTPLEQLRDAWENVYGLGTLALSLTDEEWQEVKAASSPKEIAHIKKAANKAWRPGFQRDACHNGERVEIAAADQSKTVSVKSKNGTSPFPVSRHNLTPWFD